MELVVKHFKELTIDELYEILRVRVNVFVVEQGCPYPDLDGKDQDAYHVYLKNDEGIQAYLRVLSPGVSYETASIGRVLTVQRGAGLGKVIMQEGIKVAKERLKTDTLTISAQVHAKGFYEQFGFVQVSEKYMDDGILHITMLLENL